MDFEEEKAIQLVTETIRRFLSGDFETDIPFSQTGNQDIMELQEVVHKFFTRFKEMSDCMSRLSRGDLDFTVSRKNHLAAPVKQLQASLLHLTWQTAQIAKGDYNQTVDFMGGFSQSFNKMVESLKEARHQLKLEIEKYKNLAQQKNHYLHVMAHDIRTPIGAVMGFSDILLDAPLQENQKKHVRTIKKNAENLLTLINNILDMARLENKKVDLDSIAFSPFSLAEEIRNMFAFKLKPGVNLQTEIDPDIPETLKGDPNRLRQILVNLLGNAVKFTEEGEVFLGMDLVDKKEERIEIRFRVRDTGIGIPKERIKDIFTPFSQASPDIATRYGGTGLGLAICRDLVSLMGGELKVSSELNKGTQFYFTISLGVYQKKEKEVADVSNACFTRCRILVVEDDLQELALISKILENQGVEYLPCHDPTKAYNILVRAVKDEHPFTLVWMDLDMPGMNGFELATLIRRDIRLSKLRMAAVSAHVDHFVESISPSVFSFVATKPVTPRALRRILEEASSTYPILDLPADPKMLHGVRLLVVDDNAMNRFLVKSILQKFNLVIHEAENGESALHMLKTHTYDIILMDEVMPGMRGSEVISRIREEKHPADLPILGFTAGDTPEEDAKIMEAGANGIITKPVNHDKIIEGLCGAIRLTECMSHYPNN